MAPTKPPKTDIGIDLSEKTVQLLTSIIGPKSHPTPPTPDKLEVVSRYLQVAVTLVTLIIAVWIFVAYDRDSKRQQVQLATTEIDAKRQRHLEYIPSLQLHHFPDGDTKDLIARFGLAIKNPSLLALMISQNTFEVFIGDIADTPGDRGIVTLLNQPGTSGIIKWTNKSSEIFKPKMGGNTGQLNAGQSSFHYYDFAVTLSEEQWLAIRCRLEVDPLSLAGETGSSIEMYALVYCSMHKDTGPWSCSQYFYRPALPASDGSGSGSGTGSAQQQQVQDPAVHVFQTQEGGPP